MSDKTFAVVFNGKIVEGASVDRVKQNVARMFKVEVAKIERLFTGARVAIKKGIDETTAKKYQLALRKAGALCAVVDMSKVGKKAPAAAKKRVVPSAQGGSTVAGGGGAQRKPGAAVQPARAAGGQPKYVIKQAPQSLGELGAAKVDRPGVVLVKHKDIPPPQIDTSELSMDQPGATLTRHRDVPEPEVDTSGLSMAEPGAAIGAASRQEALNVDISGLSMDEPGVTIIESKKVPVPNIDTSKLSVE